MSGYAPHVRGKKILAVIQAFVDDSASQIGERRFFLAALVNKADAWARFASDWKAELDAGPHRSIDYFKMAEANDFRNQFEGWSEQHRNDKVSRLAQIVRSYQPWSIECSVSQEEHDRILKPVAPRGLGHPYFSCFHALMIGLARYHLSMGAKLPVDFIFDDHGGLGAEAVLFFDYIRSQQNPDIRKVLGSAPVFKNDKDMLPLQAADMLAWHVRRESEGKLPAYTKTSMGMLRASGMHVIMKMDAAQLKASADKMALLPEVGRTQRKSDWQHTKRRIASQIADGRAPTNQRHWRDVWYYIRKILSRLSGGTKPIE